MKIVKAEVSIVEIPFHLRGTGVGIMPTAWKSLEFALIRLEDELGNVGWGEGFGYFTVDATKAIIDRLILPSLVGATIEDIPAWNRQIQRSIHMFGRYGITIFAIGGVDIALWDLAAKRAGKPLYQLLGEGRREQIPFYASMVRYGTKELATMTCREVIDAGFNSIKLHEIDLDIIEACRQVAGPDKNICVDVNCAWSVEFVERNRERLEALNLTWLEEPVYPPEDFKTLSSLRGSLPIAAGENWTTAFQFANAFQAGAVDIVQPSVTKVGGISEFLAIIELAGKSGSALMPHSPYFGPGFFASLHLAAANPSVQALEYNFVQPDAWLADVEGLRQGDLIKVPQVAGLGFQPDYEVMSKYRRA
ncbi:mandelate racemase/muconate lactonizing enzyme family protein [Pseudomonas auratipiscis]|uniref:Mandelate racemase/muconate lactonizing enzyme family protein n=1 Tax=Pseudomonas auratipiscis TaxID=3115853 RepID=A0AB35WR16_9PSED|nr:MULTISPECIES: mandelate racemase/muconate lactonizing enzyme family protein [unclassified Pseudomonas]MEE1865859.1 mandelate racemase/muconate lactonizing enzyme family protein [Pseudomonas sp. 120P]MEE1956972.1 mandelate racemase/muconate lactonizing enzyme family protein [Pseudomonas sp. 119P]